MITRCMLTACPWERGSFRLIFSLFPGKQWKVNPGKSAYYSEHKRGLRGDSWMINRTEVIFLTGAAVLGARGRE